MMEIPITRLDEAVVDSITPARHSFAEQSAARLARSKSRLFLVLGLGTELSPLPATLSTCSNPSAVLRVVALVSKARVESHEKRILIELKGRQSPRARLDAAKRIVSAIE